MTDQRNELDARLLAEARARAHGRNFKRFLVLIAAAFVMAAYAVGQRDETLGFVAAGVIALVALVVLLRTDER